jgi:hypothetical protein
MRPKANRPQRNPETFMNADLQKFSGEALDPDDPRLEPRVRRGRPQDRKRGSKKKGQDRNNNRH